jgi:RNA polymerase sigma-70 factor (ECF subfamily)
VSAPPSASDSLPPVEGWFLDDVRPHEPDLRAYLRNRFPSLDPDDVVQESYLRLLRARRPAGLGSGRAYFFSVARNAARRLFRLRGRLYADVSVRELPDWRLVEEGPNAAEITDQRQRLELVADALDALPRRCAEVMRLAVVDGQSSAEIAARLGLAESTVRVQLARGIARCAAFLRERGALK